MCVSGRNKTIREWIDVNGIKCADECEREEEEEERDEFDKVWSNASIWPNQQLPAEGDNVTIPYEWSLIMDIDPPVLNYLKINGILKFDHRK